MCHCPFERQAKRPPRCMDAGLQGCDGKCVTSTRFGGRHVWDCSTDEGSNNGGSIAWLPWDSLYKTCRSIAVVVLAIGTPEWGVQYAGLHEVFAGGTTTATPCLQATTMHRAIKDVTKLVNYAVISAGHASSLYTHLTINLNLVDYLICVVRNGESNVRHDHQTH